MGHEIGYHYETLDRAKGNKEKAIKLFASEIKKFRQVCEVKTICMHGNLLSKWDNRDIWNWYDYKKYNILAEPYFDLNSNEIYYLTDTGRKWNNSSVSIRDKVEPTKIFEVKSNGLILLPLI